MAFRNIPPNGFPAIPDIEDLEAVVKDVGTLKATTAALAEDVGDLEDQKANQITIALQFNPETEYEVGDLVYYNGLTYRCTNAHTGEWDADDFAGTTIANELASLKSGLIGKVSSAARGYISAESSINIPISGGFRGLLVTDGIALSQHAGIYIVAANSSGEAIGVADVKSCTGITVTGGNRQLTIANSYTGEASYNLFAL